MTKEYKYHGEWQQTIRANLLHLPAGQMIEAYHKKENSTPIIIRVGNTPNSFSITNDELYTYYSFYRIVSDEPITEAQKQEALEEQRRKDGWVVWSDRAECATLKSPHDKVKILLVNDEVACYETHDSLVFCRPSDGKWRDSKGRSFRDFNDFDLVPYVEKPTMYNIKECDKYWALSCDKLSNYSWENSEYDKASRSLGLCSRTKEGAEAIRDRLIAEEEQRRKENEG